MADQTVISSGGIPEGAAPTWICPACSGSGEAPDNLRPLTIRDLNPHRVCLLCKGVKRIPTVLAVEHPFTDARGSIQNIVHEPVGSVVVITSKASTVRAQHWHKTDWHLCYVLSGRIRYVEASLIPVRNRPEGSEFEYTQVEVTTLPRESDLPYKTILRDVEHPDLSKRAEYVIPAGWLFYTPPMVAHAMFFLENTVFLTLGNRSRTPEDHESDLVRLAPEDHLR